MVQSVFAGHFELDENETDSNCETIKIYSGDEW